MQRLTRRAAERTEGVDLRETVCTVGLVIETLGLCSRFVF